jgi:hypothetical protein
MHQMRRRDLVSELLDLRQTTKKRAFCHMSSNIQLRMYRWKAFGMYTVLPV